MYVTGRRIEVPEFVPGWVTGVACAALDYRCCGLIVVDTLNILMWNAALIRIAFVLKLYILFCCVEAASLEHLSRLELVRVH
jgi:hypothetical protein